MFFSVKRHGECFSFPVRCVEIKAFEEPFIVGIEFVHYFHSYLFKDSGQVFDESAHEKVRTTVRMFVECLKSLNILPVFVMPGLSASLPSFASSQMVLSTQKIIAELGVVCVKAPADACAQLAAMVRHKAVNAVMSSCEVCFGDVKQWIHYIDVETRRALILSVDRQKMLEILSNPVFSQYLCSPFVVDGKLCWLFRPPLFEKVPPPISVKLINMIMDGLLPVPYCAKQAMLPQKCVAYFEMMSSIMVVIFRSLLQMPLSCIPIPPLGDEFLPLMLQQNPCPQSIPLDNSLIFQVLSQQNMVSRPFTTLFDALKNVTSANENKGACDTQYIITESTRRFLTALDYVAPGGGLSAWGRAVLVANSGFDEATVMFIELIRGDCMDTEIGSSSGVSVGVMEIIERTFNFFECESSKYMPSTSHFITVVNALQAGLQNLFRIITVSVHSEFNGEDPLPDVLSKIPFQKPQSHGAGTLMRFMFESPEDKLKDFIKTVDNRDQLRLDVKKALTWWSNMSRATQELKQRSLKPNSRVSNLRTILVLFECADELVRQRSSTFLTLL